MTIRRGEDWGTPRPRPPGLRVASTDAELASCLTDGTDRPVLAAGGDLARTLGAPANGRGRDLNELPIDLLTVTLDRRHEVTCAAHAIARRPRAAGGWMRGEVLFVMNAQFFGNWNLIPRGHPNDGRADLLRVDPAMGLRQRVEAARRAPTAGHLPHPRLRIRRLIEEEFVFEQPMQILADGIAVATARSLQVRLEPDAAIVYS